MSQGGVLSGSTHGKNIKVTGTDTTGADTIHTGVAATDQVDRVMLYAFNSSASDVLLTLAWGGVVDPDDLMEITVPPLDGWYALTPVAGLPIRNSLEVKAFAATANVIVLTGFVVQGSVAEVWG